MTYSLSASKLQTYHRCAKSYHFRYEQGIKSAAFFGSAALGTSLHQALAQIYRDWHYQTPLPDLTWINACWSDNSKGLSDAQAQEGQQILQGYYESFIANQPAIAKPVAVEGKVQGSLRVSNLEFSLIGRFDRLDWYEDGLELIDYKSTKETKLPEPTELDLQMGLYYLALEQRYQQSLKQLSLIFLRTGEKVSFRATPEQSQRVYQMISELAIKLRSDEEWEPSVGKHCDRCTYVKYCPAKQTDPEPVPSGGKSSKQLQLTLNL
ncbi:RecB family exonuclease [Tumidithrix helvetica PCC 7403]|uniref:RecB family exonuclease n=1 Tax=Tumidithrix helvetica TaxID=3457545 RepID=UPI003C8AE578